MAAGRLGRRDKLSIGSLILVGAIGLSLSLVFYSEAFPQASIAFIADRDAAFRLGREAMARSGFDPANHKRVAVFETDETALMFIQKNLASEDVEQFLARGVEVWWWRVRWFKPLQAEEFTAQISPGGYLVGFRHLLPEDAPGASLDESAARAVADEFLSVTEELDAAVYREVEVAVERRPARIDYTFTFERRNFALAGAVYRLEVYVQGASPGGYRQYVKPPKSWLRDYRTMRSRNQMLTILATTLSLPLGLGAVFIFLLRYQRRDLNWKPAVLFSLLMSALYLVMNVNALPLELSYYPTTQPYGSYVVRLLLSAVVSAIVNGFMVFALAAVGESLYRELFPARQRFDRFFSRRGWRSREALLAPIAGYSFAMAMVGYIVMFYLVGKRLGAWVPMEVQYSDLLSTFLPVVFPVTISVSASLTEEFMFRLFAISFLKKYLKSDILAVLIPAFLWGFLHSNYPQEPSWIRGVEVGVMGVLAGLLFLRFGIIACLIWHYVVDAGFMGMFLFRSADPFHVMSGMLSLGILLPLLGYAVWSYRRNGRFEDAPELLNETPPPQALAWEPPVKESRQAARLVYTPLSRRARLAGMLLAGTGALLIWLCPVRYYGDFIQLREPRQRIRDRAGEVLARVADRERFVMATGALRTDGGMAYKYLRDQLGTEEAYRRLAGVSAGYYWRVRCFRSLEREEWSVVLAPDGVMLSLDHVIPDIAEGDDLSRAQAVALGVDHITGVLHRSLDGYELFETEQLRHPNRSDWRLLWRGKEPLGGKAYHVQQLTVQGAEPVDYRCALRVPEDWQREQQKTSLRTLLFQMVQVLVISAGMVVLVFSFFNALVKNRIRWTAALPAAVAMAAAGLLGDLVGLPGTMLQYDTTEPLRSFQVNLVMGMCINLALLFVGIFLLLSAVSVLWGIRGAGGGLAVRCRRRSYLLDGAAAGAGAGLLSLGWWRLWQYIIECVNAPVRSVPIIDQGPLADCIPAVGYFSGMIQVGVPVVAVLCALLAIHASSPGRRFWLVAGLAVMAVATAGVEAQSASAAALLTARNLGFAFMAVTVLPRLIRRNLLAMTIAPLIFMAWDKIGFLLGQSTPCWRRQGLFLLLLCLLPALVIALLSDRDAAANAAGPSSAPE
ncbi:CPBP family intramembrane metalloprotease [bacterium]|nr:CPBP family intramembrane metalloprotease [candidate division CSSED10-310 bacterium]